MVHGCFRFFDLSRAEDDEQRVLVALDLGALMRRERVFDREIVESELLLHLAKQRLVRLEEPDPHERVGALDDVADVIECHLADASAVRVRHAGNDATRRRRRRHGVHCLPITWHSIAQKR